MPEQFSGKVEIIDSASNITIMLDGDSADILAGGNGQAAELILKDSAGNERIRINGQTGNLIIKNEAGDVILNIGKHSVRRKREIDVGDITVTDDVVRTVPSFETSYVAALYIGMTNNAGEIHVYDGAGRDNFRFGRDGIMSVRDGAGKNVFQFFSDSATLYIGARDNAGEIHVYDGAGNPAFRFDSDHALLGIGTTTNAGEIRVYNNSGHERIRLDGNTGDIRLMGADCAEEFDVSESEKIDSGTVLVIDDETKLCPCRQPYDRKVAGVVSGGNGSNPGIILDKRPTKNKRLPVALNGKVYCKVDAQYSPIEVGDLLTTSPTHGHAMKADDPLKAFGAVIGKALRPLKTGKGLIPIIVALQ